MNRFHLHAILVHRGNLDYGHYYAFIRPNISDDRWYEFNDNKVSEVSKHYAFNQGIGGEFKNFELLRGNQYAENSISQLTLRKFENETNAYMLIYVRESERNDIMADTLSID